MKNGTPGCGPQPFVESPSHDTPLIRLTELAMNARDAITECEKTATPHYWRLGQILTLARKQVARGAWADFLGTLGIEKTRASKARAIFRAFGSVDETACLSVSEAYERRVRSPHAKDRRPDVADAGIGAPVPKVTLPRWILMLAEDAARLRDEIEFLNDEEIETVLRATEQAIVLLTELRSAAGKRTVLT